MSVSTTRARIGVLFCILLACIPAFAGEAPGADGVSAEEAMAMLVRGNSRFVSGTPLPKSFAAERKELASDQHPYAIVVACADSRVPPELLFDESLGKLFVIRVAGNVMDPVVLGSIEYAAEHLHTHLLLVLGHRKCGAVTAAVSGGDYSPNIGALVTRISPAVDVARAGKVAEGALLDAAVRENVRYQIHMALYQSEVLADLIRQHELTIVGGVYDLESGKVDFLPTEVAVVTSGPRTDSPVRDEPAAIQPAPETPLDGLGALVRRAFESRSDVRTTRPLIVRDETDRCATHDCRSIPAGARMHVMNPSVVAVGPKYRMLVEYGGRTCYVLADDQELQF